MQELRNFKSKRANALRLYSFIVFCSLICLVTFEIIYSVGSTVQSKVNTVPLENVKKELYKRPVIVFTRILKMEEFNAETSAFSVTMKMIRRQFKHASKMAFTEYFLDPNGEANADNWSEQTFHDSIYTSSPIQ